MIILSLHRGCCNWILHRVPLDFKPEGVSCDAAFPCTKTSRISKKRFVKCLRSTGAIPCAAYEKSCLKLRCIKETLERKRKMAHVLTGRTCGPGGNLLNAAADACPGAARPVDSSPRCCAHLPPKSPSDYRSPLPTLHWQKCPCCFGPVLCFVPWSFANFAFPSLNRRILLNCPLS